MRRFALCLTLVAFVAQPAFAQSPNARTASHYRYQGLSGSASFFSPSEDGCGGNDVYVSVHESMVKGSGPGYSLPNIFVMLSRWDGCTGEYSGGFAQGVIPEGAFKATGDLGRAGLRVTVEGYDWSTYETFTLEIDLTWVAQGSPNQSSNVTSSSSGGYFLREVFRGTDRFAHVTGSVHDGVEELVGGGTGYGQLSKTTSGNLTLYKPIS